MHTHTGMHAGMHTCMHIGRHAHKAGRHGRGVRTHRYTHMHAHINNRSLPEPGMPVIKAIRT